MKASRLVLAPLPVVVVALALLACKKAGGSTAEVKGSCDMRAASGGSSICIDFHTEPNEKVKSICSPSSGYVLSTARCDTSTALGGCQKGKLTNWYYSSSKHTSADDVKRECSDSFVAPGGK